MYGDDLDKLREFFAERHGKPKSEQESIFKTFSDSMSAKDSKQVMVDIKSAEKNMLKDTTKAMEDGLLKMYRNAGYGGSMSTTQQKFGAKVEVSAMKDGLILPSISAKNAQINRLNNQVTTLTKDKSTLEKSLTGIKDKFKDLNNKFSNLTGNLIKSEGFTKEKIDKLSMTPVPGITKTPSIVKSV